MSASEAPIRRESATDRQIAAFVDWLQRLAPSEERAAGGAADDADGTGKTPRSGNRAALAALRRSVGREPGEVVEACRYVDPLLPPWTTGKAEEAFYLVAGLFGWHPTNRTGKDLGGSFAELAAAQRAAGLEPAGVERRFVALLDADREDLPQHLRHAVSLLRTNGIPLDFARLLRDVLSWDHPDRFVRRRWARSFWSRDPGTGEAAVPGSMDSAAPTA